MVDYDKGDQSKLPKIVSEAYRGAGGAFPIVVFADPGLKKVYGSFGHAALKGQDYRAIFRDTKASVRDAIKAGTFSKDLAAAGDAPKPAAGDDGEPAADDPVGIVKVENGTFQDWTSAKGSKINAKLVAVEGDSTFVFETKAGKTIRASAAHLSNETVKRARELAGL